MIEANQISLKGMNLEALNDEFPRNVMKRETNIACVLLIVKWVTILLYLLANYGPESLDEK